MNKHLENQLRSMPTAKLGFEDKNRIHDALMNFEEHPVQKTLKNIKWPLHTIGSLVAVALLVFFIWTLPQNPISNQAFLGEEQIMQIKELQMIERKIKLPTYAPFVVHEVEFMEQYLGPQSLEDGELKQLEPDNPKFHVQNISYLSFEEPFKSIHLILADSTVESVDTKDYENVQLSNGSTAYYMFNGNAQMLFWIEEGINYHLNVFVKNKDNTSFREEPIPREEIIKIAESFRVYKK
ncbi:DUF4367 domain-containing protein [Bacillus sp. REN16]|uniref:DUF4367 domain-containing protein n=1 Tax=Bacillus sp. REN16 TaxID=2887296 RepID=UPI001E31B545|nr:DUF4367 domain-containing protein [Bacillus sp. REN16]MCC3356043.1 DUF4367 domain-containing protein [Bacillus sp. REN16]